MKKTLKTVAIFVIVLIVLLVVAAGAKRIQRSTSLKKTLPEGSEDIIALVYKEDATMIYMDGDKTYVTGDGAKVTDGDVLIYEPGTYLLSGVMTDGQVVVDCNDYHGTVCLMLDGADITCTTGPAVHVEESDLTILRLVAGSENRVQDGGDYMVDEGKSQSSGGAVYSADPLLVDGEGALTVVGYNSDGIRTKDDLTIQGGSLTISAADDGLQGCDYILIEGGSVAVNSYGDGIATTEGFITVSGGSLNIASAGDGISAFTDLTVTGGDINITAAQGADNYAQTAIADVSAKGLKGANITVEGGNVTLNTADDGMNADASVAVTGGTLTIYSGDDALRAAETVSVSGGTLSVPQSYEGLEAALVSVSGGCVNIMAENNGVDAGTGGFILTDGLVSITAPRCVGAETTFSVESGSLSLIASDGQSPLSFGTGMVTGGTLIACGDLTANHFTEDGALPGSLLYMFSDGLPAGTAAVLYDSKGAVVMSFETPQDCSALLIASGALGVGQSYTLTAGEYTAQAVLGTDCTVVE